MFRLLKAFFPRFPERFDWHDVCLEGMHQKPSDYFCFESSFMYKTVELESTKYWAKVTAADQAMTRQLQRRMAIERCILFATFSATAIGLSYLLANGYFDSVDIIGPLERFVRAVGLGS